MPADALIAVLIAALLHACWNAAAKSAANADPLHNVAAITIGGAIVAAPLLLISGLPAAGSTPYVIASGIIHVAYFLLVGLAYRHGDYSVAYPVTRGSAPLATTLLSAGLIGETLPAGGWLGVLLLSAGVVGLGSEGLRRGGFSVRSMWIAAATAAIIVGYTLLDGLGARRSENAAGYVLAMMLLTGALMAPVLLAWLGPAAVAPIAAQWRVGLIGGAMVSLSYGTALWAMTRAPIGMVAALRETSVLFAAVIAAVVLKERFGAVKWASAALILAGLVLLRLA